MYEYIEQENGPTLVVRKDALPVSEPGTAYLITDSEPVLVVDLAQPTVSAPAPMPAIPGLVITEAGDPNMQLIPYEKQDRTPAGPLQLLEIFAAERLGIDRDLLVSLRGQITERGAVVLFGRNAEPAGMVPVGYVVASYDADEEGDVRLKIAERHTGQGADRAYASRLEALS